jgi:hypothetical protein
MRINGKQLSLAERGIIMITGVIDDNRSLQETTLLAFGD